MGMLVLFGSGVFLWLIYGICIRELPVIAANAITFVLITTILILKIRYD